MQKNPLIGVSIGAVVLLVLGSLSNVVGYQTVQTSQQNLIKERINQRELLFQTIVDIVNNKEIQRTILISQMSKGIFPVSDFPVVTKNQLKHLYLLGLLLSKVISTSRMQSILGKYQFHNQELEQEISAAIEKDPALKGKITLLQNSECDCENKEPSAWSFPVICSVLYLLIILLDAIFLFIYRITGVYLVQIYNKLVNIIGVFGTLLKCSWI